MVTIPDFDYERTEREAKSSPGQFVPAYPDMVFPGGDVGGDIQTGESYERRFVRWIPELGKWEVITDYFYLCFEEDDETGIPSYWVQNQVERILCTDFRDPGGTEEEDDTVYVDHWGVADEDSARHMAGLVTPAAYWGLPTPKWLVEAHAQGRAYYHRLPDVTPRPGAEIHPVTEVDALFDEPEGSK